jgi:ribonuclease-3
MEDSQRKAIEAALGHTFQDAAWLERALTHSSWRNARVSAAVQDNERLEFLGDRVLGLVTSFALFHDFSEWEVGRLSNGLARLVNAPSLEAAARRIGLGQYLRLGRGEELTGGRGKRNLLSDAYEAVIAAIYLDGGLDAAERFIRRTLLGPALEGGLVTLADPDHKSALQEWLQHRGQACPRYRVVRQTGPDHHKQFGVEIWLGKKRLGESEGLTKKEAEQEAARIALLWLRSEAKE